MHMIDVFLLRKGKKMFIKKMGAFLSAINDDDDDNGDSDCAPNFCQPDTGSMCGPDVEECSPSDPTF